MKAFKTFGSKLGTVGELFEFLWRNKRWWLIPVVVVLVLVGMILIFSQSSAIGRAE
jgi:drug/metabolite transporter superfamily protein YnfA